MFDFLPPFLKRLYRSLLNATPYARATRVPAEPDPTPDIAVSMRLPPPPRLADAPPAPAAGGLGQPRLGALARTPRRRTHTLVHRRAARGRGQARARPRKQAAPHGPAPQRPPARPPNGPRRRRADTRSAVRRLARDRSGGLPSARHRRTTAGRARAHAHSARAARRRDHHQHRRRAADDSAA